MKKTLRTNINGLASLIFILYITGCHSISRVYKQGLKKFDNGEYELAIQDFEKAVAGNYETDRSHFMIAESYRLSNRVREAIPYYKKAIDAGTATTASRFEYAYALKASGLYDEARNEFAAFAQSDSADSKLKERARREIEILRIAPLLKQNKMNVKVENMLFNTPGSEFSPVVLGSDLVISSSRKETVYKNNGQAMLGLYRMKIGDEPSESGGTPTVFSQNIFVPDVNEGSPAFTPDGKTLVFARGNSGKKKGPQDVHLYMSRLVDGAWTEPRYLPVNDSLSWDGSPAFSRDGKTLYFASNRPGGFGGIDIYRTNMDASGRFSKPVNMGEDINTPGDEMFPYVASDGRLFFASDGHPGLGKLDIFVATRSQGVITVENMGVPFNTPQDDFGLVFYGEENENGFFASNREGGRGDDDIYYFYTEKTTRPDSTPIAKTDDPRYFNGELKVVRYFLAGNVISNDPEGTPIDSAIVHVMLPDTADHELARFTTGEAGTFGNQKVEEVQNYILLTERKGYISKRTPFSMNGKTIPPIFLTKALTDTVYRVTIRLDRLELNKTFVLENIYYDLNKYNIRPDAAAELDKLAQELKDNPTISIELSSHTDSRASDAYNLTLSQRRAESAVNYLISKGIDESRLVAKGYGERQLIVPNAKTEEEHQRNRRTEFTILSY